MSPFYTTIEIDGEKINFRSRQSGGDKKEIRWEQKISPADKARLYQAFVENRVDLIKNYKKTSPVYDSGSEGIFISIDAKTFYSVSYGENFQLAGDELRRYQAIVSEFKNIARKYSGNENQRPEQ